MKNAAAKIDDLEAERAIPRHSLLQLIQELAGCEFPFVALCAQRGERLMNRFGQLSLGDRSTDRLPCARCCSSRSSWSSRFRRPRPPPRRLYTARQPVRSSCGRRFRCVAVRPSAAHRHQAAAARRWRHRRGEVRLSMAHAPP